MEQQNTFFLTALPEELILKIAKCSDLSIQDICNLQCTCSYINQILQNNNLWNSKFRQRWPAIFYLTKSNEDFNKISGRNKCIYNILLARKLEEFTKSVSKILYVNGKLRLRDKYELKCIFDEHSYTKFCTYIHVRELLQRKKSFKNPYLFEKFENDEPVEEIQEYFEIDICMELNFKSYADMSLEYCAQMVLFEIHSFICKLDFDTYMKLPVEEHRLEKGAFLIGQYVDVGQKITYDTFESDLNLYFDMILNRLKETNPRHPVLKYAPNFTSVDDGVFKLDHHIIQILDAIQFVLYVKNNFVVTYQKEMKVSDHIIFKALKQTRCSYNIMSIFYVVFCSKFSIKAHTLKESYIVYIPGNEIFVDIYKQGKVLKHIDRRTNIQNLNETLLALTETIKNTYYSRITNGVSVDYLFLDQILQEVYYRLVPSINRMSFDAMMSINREFNMSLSDIVDTMRQHHSFQLDDFSRIDEVIRKELDEQPPSAPEIIPKRREGPRAKVKFAVGMVCLHKLYGYYCVISGWDEFCNMPDNWIRRMGVRKLKYSVDQPFYNVLANDGSNRYSAEENLIVVGIKPQKITHFEIGRVFDGFENKYYIPNNELSTEYPDDKDVLRDFYSQNC